MVLVNVGIGLMSATHHPSLYSDSEFIYIVNLYGKVLYRFYSTKARTHRFYGSV